MARLLSRQRSTATAPQPAEKLRFVEFLLGCDDPNECAERAVEWLAANAGAEHALCATVDLSGARLVGVAGHGLERVRPGDVVVDLEQRDHPFVAALRRKQPVVAPA